MSLNPRNAALIVLTTLDKSHKTLDAVMDEVLGRYPSASKRDKSLLQSLVYGVLRHRKRLDWIISRFSTTKLKKINPRVLHVLRLGVFQITCLDRIPNSAAVNTSVEMVKPFSAPYVVRFVNGVLRNADRGCHQLVYPSVEKDPIEALSIVESFPSWIIKRWLKRFGLPETQSLLAYLNSIAPITIRANTLKTTKSALSENLSADARSIRFTPYAENGICFDKPRVPVFELESFHKGWFQVQDEAAQLVTTLLGPRPGETILDACSGLGGKTGHIAQLMKNSGKIIAADTIKTKGSKLISEMRRLGISIVSTKQCDLTSVLPVDDLPLFDRILIDAPCSGLGVLRKNPDTKWKRSPVQFAGFKKTQLRLLENLAGHVRPGGVIVYAVCSMEPEENEEVVDTFLGHHKNFIIENAFSSLPRTLAPLVNDKGFLKTLPHLHHMDGFFAAKLIRSA